MEKLYQDVPVSEGEEYFVPRRNNLMIITRVTDDHILARNIGGWKENLLEPIELTDATKIGESIGSKIFKVDVTPVDTSMPLDDKPEVVDTSYDLD